MRRPFTVKRLAGRSEMAWGVFGRVETPETPSGMKELLVATFSSRAAARDAADQLNAEEPPEAEA